MNFTNPFKEWKNLTENPSVIIRRNILRFGELYHNLDKAVGFLKNYKKTINNNINQISRLDISLKDHEKKLNKEKSAKKRLSLNKSLHSYKKHRDTLLAKNNKIEKDYVKYSTESHLNFIEMIKLLYGLNIQSLTLIHRSRKDINNLIAKVKKVKHIDVQRLEKIKYESIVALNNSKLHLKRTADKLYRSSEFQDRNAFNPSEVLREVSIQSTVVKVKRIRQKTVEIDAIENKIDKIMEQMVITDIPWFVEHNLNHQIKDFDVLSHHIKILNHRVNKLVYIYVEKDKLQKTFKKILRRLVKQTRLLWNNIKIKHYKPKFQKEYKQAS